MNSFARRMLLLLLLTGVGVGALFGSSRGSSSAGLNQSGQDPGDCLTLVPPCPPALPAAVLTAEETHREVGWIFAPPGLVQPDISATTALAIAWPDAAFTEPTVVLPILALLPKGGTFDSDALVWILRFQNACVPVHGPPGADLPKCGGAEWNVIVNADSGDFIAAYSDR